MYALLKLNVLLLPVVITGILVLLFAVTRKKTAPTNQETWKIYRRKGNLLTDSELNFYHVLKEIVHPNETVFAKVRQADLIEVIGEKHQPHFWPWFNKISQRHVDFVICDKNTTAPKTIIELNDRSHDLPNRRNRDAEVREAFKYTGIRLLEIPTAKQYNPKEIKALIYPSPVADAPTPTVNPPAKTHSKPSSLPSVPPTTDKRTPAYKDKEPLPKPEAQTAATAPHTPAPSDQNLAERYH